MVVAHVPVWKLPWQGGSLFHWHCFKGLSPCISALKIVTGIPRWEHSLLFGALWETVNMLVMSTNRLKTEDPVALNTKIFQCSMFICSLSQRTQTSSSMSKNYTSCNFIVPSLKSVDFSWRRIIFFWLIFLHYIFDVNTLKFHLKLCIALWKVIIFPRDV